jgi:hypothetical protein
MTPTQKRVAETLESWATLNDFKELVHYVSFWIDRRVMPDLITWNYLKDYEELVDAVQILLSLYKDGSVTND